MVDGQGGCSRNHKHNFKEIKQLREGGTIK
jgi:hypothetical protein